MERPEWARDLEARLDAMQTLWANSAMELVAVGGVKLRLEAVEFAVRELMDWRAAVERASRHEVLSPDGALPAPRPEAPDGHAGTAESTPATAVVQRASQDSCVVPQPNTTGPAPQSEVPRPEVLTAGAAPPAALETVSTAFDPASGGHAGTSDVASTTQVAPGLQRVSSLGRKWKARGCKLEGSIWDAALLMGVAGQGAACTAWALMLLCLNVVVQFSFSWIVMSELTEPFYTKARAAQYATWRKVTGQGLEYYDQDRRLSLAAKVCLGHVLHATFDLASGVMLHTRRCVRTTRVSSSVVRRQAHLRRLRTI